MGEVTENPLDEWFTEEDRESLFNTNCGSFKDWLATQPDTPIFVTEEEAKDYYGQDTDFPVHTVKVDLWYILPEKYQWFSRDVDEVCEVWTHKPIFDEANGLWERTVGTANEFAEVMEVTNLVNVIFPDSNLEERPK